MSTVNSAGTGAFAAFSVPNYRRFVLGQSVSVVGSWTETVAQALLILQLTHSGIILGLATAARYLPVLLLTPYAGLIVDRHNKRRVLLFTQTSLAALSLILGVLIATGTVQVWSVFAIALGFGCLTALDNPARQAFIPEIVGQSLIRNAITLNSTFVNVGRAVGPLVAAVLVSTIGLAWCFFVNAASFGAVLIALFSMNLLLLHPTNRQQHRKGQLLEGFRYALTVPEILAPVLMMAFIGTFTYEFEVSLPLFARTSLSGSPTTYSWLIGAFGVGSVLGGIYAAKHPKTGVPRLIRIAALYTVAMIAAALAPDVWVAVPIMAAVGVASILFLTTGNSTIQIAAKPEYRGRVTALWSTAFLGSTPIGATIIGFIGDQDPRAALMVGAAACLFAAALGAMLLRQRQHARSAVVDA